MLGERIRDLIAGGVLVVGGLFIFSFEDISIGSFITAIMAGSFDGLELSIASILVVGVGIVFIVAGALGLDITSPIWRWLK